MSPSHHHGVGCISERQMLAEGSGGREACRPAEVKETQRYGSLLCQGIRLSTVWRVDDNPGGLIDGGGCIIFQRTMLMQGINIRP
jgi:hypothetical protein